jgi:hypothetical protein
MLRHTDDLNWTLDVERGIDLDRAGILEFRIDKFGSYIAHSNRLSRRIRDYEENVWRLGQGLPYLSGGSGYRRIHRLLRDAADKAMAVTVIALENCEEADLPVRKRHWIEVRGTLNRAD